MSASEAVIAHFAAQLIPYAITLSIAIPLLVAYSYAIHAWDNRKKK